MNKYKNIFEHYNKKKIPSSYSYRIFIIISRPVDKSFRGSNQQVSIVKGEENSW
jgi:hypothetical protein